MGPGVGIPSVHGGAWVNLTTVHGEDGRGRVREMGEGSIGKGVMEMGNGHMAKGSMAKGGWRRQGWGTWGKGKRVREMGKGCINKDFKWMHVVPDTGISNKAMTILNCFVKDFFEHIATHASNLATYSKKSTMSL